MYYVAENSFGFHICMPACLLSWSTLLYKVRGIGDESLGELLPWLLETLQSESSAVDRSGAAQGLSEVLLAQGFTRLSQLMPRFIESSQDPANPTHVRDGYLMLFVYLPIAFGDEFTPFLADLLPCILKVSLHHFSNCWIS